MVQQFLAIARNAFAEATRQPIYLVMMLVGTLMLVLGPALSTYTLQDDNKILVDMGLSTLFLSGLLLAAFTATGVVSTELENRTVLTVISKPVARPIFVLGKYAGVSAALALGFWTLTLVFLLTVRHKVMQRAADPFDVPVILFGSLAGVLALAGATLANIFYRWVFTGTFVFALAATTTVAVGLVLVIDKNWQFQPIMTDLNLQLLTVLLLVFEAVLILTAVAIACSTRLGQIMTLLVCAAVYLLGLIGHHFDQQLAILIADMHESLLHQIVFWVLKGFFLLVPNLQYLWHADALLAEHPISAVHLLVLTSYSLLYIGAILSVAIGLFQSRQVG